MPYEPFIGLAISALAVVGLVDLIWQIFFVWLWPKRTKPKSNEISRLVRLTASGAALVPNGSDGQVWRAVRFTGPDGKTATVERLVSLTEFDRYVIPPGGWAFLPEIQSNPHHQDKEA